MNEIMKKEGFWYSKDEPDLPVPKPNTLNSINALNIFNKIKKLEKSCKSISYKGSSYSRITNERLSNIEYITKDKKWCFPGLFAEHYVLKHGISPTKEFLIYLLQKN